MLNSQSDDSYTEVIQHKINKPNGQIAIKRYGKGKFLGKGGFAKCYQGICLESNRPVAIKVVQKSTLTKNRAKQKLLSEIKIHKTLHHQNIVEFDSVFQDSNYVYMIIELCTNKSLSQMVRKRKHLTIPQTKYYLLQLLSALQYMHSNKVIHRDLKMGNIFLNDKMEMKVGDFGLAAKLQFTQQKKRTMCGTPNYIAPQIVDGVSGHSYQVDIWSTGVICYAMIFGRPPFQTNQVKTTYKKIKNCQYVFPADDIPNNAKHFIKSILILDPKKRLTIQQMLQHPFLNTNDIPKYIPVEALNTIPDLQKAEKRPQQNIKNSKSLSTSSNLKSINLEMKYIKPEFFNKNTDSVTQRRNINLMNNKTQKQEDIAKNQLKSPRNLQIKQKQDLSKKELTTNCQTKQIYSNQHRINIISFVDYSTKYGLGYLINNRTYGVYFNDSSLMSIDGDKKTIVYIDNPSSKDQNLQVFPYNGKNQLPSDKNFQKKFLLLEKFIIYLNDQVIKNNFNEANYQKYDQFIYVKQWLKTKHAIMFRLSNKLFQVNFFDNSQILLNTQQKTVLFTSKKGEKIYESLSKALQAKDSEMARRIKYTKEILNSIKKGRDEPQQK